MATYYAANGGKTVAPPKRVDQTGETLVYFRMAAILFSAADIIVLAQIPINLASTDTAVDARATYIIGAHLVVEDIDTASAFSFQLGDSSSPTTYVGGATLTMGRSGTGIVSSFDPSVGASAATGATNGTWGTGLFPRRVVAATDIRMTVVAGQTGLTAGFIHGYVRYSLNESV